MRNHDLKIKPRLTLYLHGKPHYEHEDSIDFVLHARPRFEKETSTSFVFTCQAEL